MPIPTEIDPFDPTADSEANEWYPLKRYARTAAVTCGVLFVLTVIVAAMPVCQLGASPKAACSNNMKQTGLALAMFARDHESTLPPVDYATHGVLLRPILGAGDSGHTFLNDYLIDPTALHCPADDRIQSAATTIEQFAAEIGSGSYWYLGHRVEDEETLLALVAAFKRHLRAGAVFHDDAYAEGAIATPFGRFELLQLGDPDSGRIPIIIERPKKHAKDDDAFGGNILFLDGHVEFREYPGEFPYTELTVTALESLDREQ